MTNQVQTVVGLRIGGQSFQSLLRESFDNPGTNGGAHIQSNVTGELQERRFTHLPEPKLLPKRRGAVGGDEFLLCILIHIAPVESRRLEIEAMRWCSLRRVLEIVLEESNKLIGERRLDYILAVIDAMDQYHIVCSH